MEEILVEYIARIYIKEVFISVGILALLTYTNITYSGTYMVLKLAVINV